MASKKTIAIIGATGAQGGGLAHVILSDQNSEFQVRAVTRDPGSDKAQKLASLGAEVVKADLDNLESLKRVFKDAYGIFCVTNYWEHFSTDREIEQASNMAKAASNAGAKHVIWSTLEDTRGWIPLDDDRMPTLKDKYKVPHFDAKGEANSFFTKHDVPTTFMMASFYWDNMIFFGMGPQKDPNGNLSITFPMGDKKMPGIAAEDIGKCAYGIFKKGSEYIGKTLELPVNTCPVMRWPQHSARPLTKKFITMMYLPMCIAASVSPEPTILATCFSFTAISMITSAVPEMWTNHALSTLHF